eukprot:CAMPEP_0179163932 /NCGR_PEP_ID=MMETSP0796-20121207/80410_1 /TAXON_ID=73915 /ORGANISM="Pyrodinium bahamense, Strain pbaha01" /LENGTH=271 /DNA_ID=CAMNT_0020866309 /DNA_START=8 /DNA_END=823 /DNA_ORIENTATION=-
MAAATDAGEAGLEAAEGVKEFSEAGGAEPGGPSLACAAVRALVGSTLLANCAALPWYALGMREEELTWMVQQGIRDESLGYRYATALHWAVCQFTFATMEVVPVNAAERAFALVVPLLAIVTLYPLMGSEVVLLSRFWALPRGAKADMGKLTGAAVLRQVAALALIVVVLVVFVALGWYALGESRYNTWMTRAGSHTEAFSVKYLMALHWAVCQFTFASMEVVPTNAGERAYAICVPLLATVVLYPLVGGIMLWMDRLRVCSPACRAPSGR